MKLFSAGAGPAIALVAATVFALAPALSGYAQNPANPDPSGEQSGQGSVPASVNAPSPSQKPAGKVVFQRSINATGNTTSSTGPAAKEGDHSADAPAVVDADREAVTVAGLDLDVRLSTQAQQIAVRGLVTVRNDAKAPIERIPLQISSSLNWERIRIGGHDVSIRVATVDSDSDHTGQLHEAVVRLGEALLPGATRQVEVVYSGTVAATARRLLSVGTPEDSAAHSDWDEISPDFTGLRGFGNVVWYPVTSVPVIIGDGARLFGEIGRQKLHAVGMPFHLQLTLEFPHGQAPTVVVVNGHALKLDVADPKTPTADVAGTAAADTGPMKLSFESPSLFVAARAAQPGPHLNVYTAPGDEVAAKGWIAASTRVSPMIERWLGIDSRTELTVLDLPDPDDVPWESGPLLAIPVRDEPPEQIESVLAHALTHAWMAPNPYWLNEGASNFMGMMWYDHQHQRDRALATLENGRQALALEEPPSPGEAQGQPLLRATSPVYYRTKAAYILWMLRDIAGEDVLGAALRASNAAAEKGNGDAAGVFQAALMAAAPGRDFKWLFADWIDADHGLPDLAIDKVFPNAVQSGNWLVSVTISNAGYAAAVVPVTVRSATNTTTERVLVSARGTVTPRLLVQGKPIEAQVNDGTVPETQATVHVINLEQTADVKAAEGSQP